MKKSTVFAFAAVLFCAQVFAYDDPLADTHKSLKDQTFVVETDPESSADSLNRVAGDIDLGFTLPDQAYHSSDHYRAGPFGMQDSKDKSSQSY